MLSAKCRRTSVSSKELNLYSSYLLSLFSLKSPPHPLALLNHETGNTNRQANADCGYASPNGLILYPLFFLHGVAARKPNFTRSIVRLILQNLISTPLCARKIVAEIVPLFFIFSIFFFIFFSIFHFRKEGKWRSRRLYYVSFFSFSSNHVAMI